MYFKNKYKGHFLPLQLITYKLLLFLSFSYALTAAEPEVETISLPQLFESKKEALQIHGKVIPETLDIEIGSINEKRSALTFSDIATELSTTLPLSFSKNTPSDIPLTIEVEEIHSRRPDVFGYTVLVNDKETYFRTYEEMGAGPNHYFISVPRSLIKEGKIKVTFRNEGHSPFSISRIWIYDNFFSLVEKQKVYQKMAVIEEPGLLLGLTGEKGKSVSWNDKRAKTPEEETKNWGTLFERIAPTPYQPGILISVQYANSPNKEVKEIIERDLERVGKFGLQSNLTFNGGEWGAHPNGPDGLGGYFSDIKYSKIKYDLEKKLFSPTWTSTPGNTTWPTWNDPQLQIYLKHRLTQSVHHFTQKRDFLKARGVEVPMPVINQDWGLSTGDDYNNGTVEAAKNSNITFTPGEKLTFEQKLWQYRNTAQVPKRSSETFFDAVQRDRIFIDQGKIKLPEEQAFDFYYFHTFAERHGSPLLENRWSGWQMGAGDKVWATGEFLPDLPEAYYDYIIARGKLVCVNLERTGLPNLDYLQTVYERGFLQQTIINTKSGDADLFIPQGLNLDQKPGTKPSHYDSLVLDLHYQHVDGIGKEAVQDSTQNINYFKPLKWGDSALLRPIDTKKPGIILYHLTNQDRPFERNLIMEIIAKIPRDKNDEIEVSFGPEPETVQKITTLNASNFSVQKFYPWKASTHIDLGETLKGKKSGYLQLTLRAENSKAAFGIEELRVLESWDKKSGSLLEQSLTVGQNRRMKLWIQERAVLERFQKFYKELRGDDDAYKKAQILISQGAYRSAYQLLSGEISLSLPARFSIRGGGKLGPYPLTLQLPDKDQVVLIDLIRADSNDFEFSLKTEVEQKCKLDFENLKEGSSYSLDKVGENHYRLLPTSEKSSYTAKNGHIYLDLDIKPDNIRQYTLPPQLSGILYQSDPSGIWINTQDPLLWKENPIYIPLAKEVQCTRVKSGSGSTPFPSGPVKWDQVDITIDSSGYAQKIDATFGGETGKIKAFYPPVPTGETSNGVIELESGNRYEFSNMWGFTDIKVQGLKPFMRQNKIEDLTRVLAPGKSVEIYFTPYVTNNRLPRMTLISNVK